MDGRGSPLVTVSCSGHHDALVGGLWNFFRKQHAVDVDFRTVRAHRLVLEVFLSLDKLDDAGIPDDVGSSLESLLQFLYRGTVSVREEQLDGLLEMAERLDFRMLADAVRFADRRRPLATASEPKSELNDEEDDEMCRPVDLSVAAPFGARGAGRPYYSEDEEEDDAAGTDLEDGRDCGSWNFGARKIKLEPDLDVNARDSKREVFDPSYEEASTDGTFDTDGESRDPSLSLESINAVYPREHRGDRRLLPRSYAVGIKLEPRMDSDDDEVLRNSEHCSARYPQVEVSSDGASDPGPSGESDDPAIHTIGARVDRLWEPHRGYLPRLHESGPDGRPSGRGGTRTKDKYRVAYSDHQRQALEREFCSGSYIRSLRKAELAQILKLSERQIKIWFQNRRMKEKKESKKREKMGDAKHSDAGSTNSCRPPADRGEIGAVVVARRSQGSPAIAKAPNNVTGPPARSVHTVVPFSKAPTDLSIFPAHHSPTAMPRPGACHAAHRGN